MSKQTATRQYVMLLRNQDDALVVDSSGSIRVSGVMNILHCLLFAATISVTVAENSLSCRHLGFLSARFVMVRRVFTLYDVDT